MSDIENFEGKKESMISEPQRNILQIMIAEKRLPPIADLEKLTYDKAEELIQRGNSSREIKKSETAVKPAGTVKLQVGKAEQMATYYGIPPELANMFFVVIEGSLYVKQPGLLYLASKKGYARILTVSHQSDEGWEAETKVYPVIPQAVIVALASMDKEIQRHVLDTYYGPTIGQGRANEKNVKTTKMLPFLKELAETRSVNRALRLYTGYGGTSYEEMPEASIEGEVA